MTHFNVDVDVGVIINQVSAYTGSLSHPIQPNAFVGVMYTVIFNQHIDGSMQLNTGNLRAAEHTLCPDVINMIVVNFTENSAQTTHNARLFTIINRIISYDMRSDILF